MYPIGRFVLGASTLLLMAGTVQTAVSQDLSLIGAEGDAIDLAVPPSGVVPLAFYQTTTPAQARSFDIDLSAFLSEDDQPASVGLIPAQGAQPSATARLSFAANQNRAVLQLQAPDLLPGVRYSGRMTASSPQGLKSWKVTLHRPKPVAEMIADLKRIELDVKIYDLFSILAGNADDEPSCSIVLTERNRNVLVEGITIRRADDSEAKSVIDLGKHLRFFIDGKEVPNFTQWPVSDSEQMKLRRIEPGKQLSLRAQVLELPRGEHKLTIQFDALNLKEGTAPQVELVVNVRHSIALPFLLLLVAILISYVITKGVVNWRQRLSLQEQTRALQRVWLQDLRQLAPVVWLNVTRRMVQRMLEDFLLLPTPGKLAERLEKATRLLALLRRYRSLVHQLSLSPFGYMKKWRMEEHLDDIVKRIEPDLLDEARKAAFDAEFDDFKKALADPRPFYKPLVEGAQKRAKQSISWEAMKKDLGQIGADKTDLDKLDELWGDVEAGDVSDEDKLEPLDQVCAAFEVLERQLEGEDKESLKVLVGRIAEKKKDLQIEKVFKLSNRLDWSRIRTSADNGKALITPSRQRPRATPIEALSPTRFDVVFDDDELNDLFFAKKRMTADWTFTFTPDPPLVGWWRGKSTSALRQQDWFVSAKGKTLVQFGPQAGKIEMAVELGYDGEKSEPIKGDLPIRRRSGTMFARRLFGLEEFLLILVSSVVALASGLIAYYMPKPHFGSLQDYLALFTWGVGVDQGKNLVQTLQNLRKQAKTEVSNP